MRSPEDISTESPSSAWWYSWLRNSHGPTHERLLSPHFLGSWKAPASAGKRRASCDLPATRQDGSARLSVVPGVLVTGDLTGVT